MFSIEPRSEAAERRNTSHTTKKSQAMPFIKGFLLGLLLILGSANTYAASLITGDTPAPASADLTATGTSDWIHWGLTSVSSVDRKAGVSAQISALTGVGNRFELSVPADTTTKTLTLYAGGWRARGRLDFSLSDGSASPTSIFINNPSGPVDREVSISFSAASAGQSLLITYTLLNDNGVGGNITLAGAALAGDGGMPPVTLPFTEDFTGTLDDWVFFNETDKASSWAIVVEIIATGN